MVGSGVDVRQPVVALQVDRHGLVECNARDEVADAPFLAPKHLECPRAHRPPPPAVWYHCRHRPDARLRGADCARLLQWGAASPAARADHA